MKLNSITINKQKTKSEAVRIGVVGAGKAARMFVLQLSVSAPQARVMVIADQAIEDAEAIFAEIGIMNVLRASQKQTFENALRNDNCIVSNDPSLLYVSSHIDVVVEAKDEPAIDGKASQVIHNFLRQLRII